MAKCSDFSSNFGVVGTGGADQDDAEVRAYRVSPREDGENGFGRGAGGYVVVLGRVAEQEIADAASGEVRLLACGAEGRDDLAGGEVLGVGDGCGYHLARPCPLS